MAAIVRMSPDFSLTIPRELRPYVTPGEEWLVSLVGGTLVCQRLAERDAAGERLAEFMRRALAEPDPEAPSQDDLEHIIGEVRETTS